MYVHCESQNNVPPGGGAAFQTSTSRAKSHRTDRENLIMLQKVQLSVYDHKEL